MTFYGGGVSQGRFGFPAMVEVASMIRCPWLGLFGDLDTGIPVDDVEALRAAAATAGQPTEVVRYAEAEHGFNCDRRASYHEPSATDAWSRTLAWFDRYLTGRLRLTQRRLSAAAPAGSRYSSRRVIRSPSIVTTRHAGISSLVPSGAVPRRMCCCT